MEIIPSILAFTLAIIILVTVHEFGHYWVAKKLGVKVLTFSIGFGKVLYKKTINGTDFVISLIPLGGYVKMLNSKEAEVSESEMCHEFNSQPLWARALIVLAGPGFNFIFAIFAYWLVFVTGVTGLHPIVGPIEPNSIAAHAQFQAKDKIVEVQDKSVKSWSDAMEAIIQAATSHDVVRVKVTNIQDQPRQLQIDSRDFLQSPQAWLQNLKLTPLLPEIEPIIAKVLANSPAYDAGLQVNDKIIAVDGININSWQQLVEIIKTKANQQVNITLIRDGSTVSTQVLPQAQIINQQAIGQIGIMVSSIELPDEYKITTSYGVIGSFTKALNKTWDYSKLTTLMIAKMISGSVSVKENLGGPVSIALIAKRSLYSGFNEFMLFLALISVSLAVINLLPIPVLDGGHLFMYLIELLKGSPLSESVEQGLQKTGMFLLMMLMLFVIYNDLVKVL